MEQRRCRPGRSVLSNLNIISWHLIKNWAQLSKLIAFSDLIPWKLSRSSILYWVGSHSCISHTCQKQSVLFCPNQNAASLVSVSLCLFLLPVLWAKRLPLTRSPEEQKWGYWELHLMERESIYRKCLHPKVFFFSHLKICIQELLLREGNMPESMEHLLWRWYYCDD